MVVELTVIIQISINPVNVSGIYRDSPVGIIAAPVGFVHVQESKHMVKPFTEIPKIIVEGRKGGSNLAATLVNSVLCYNDAEQLRPGRDV